MEENHSLCHVSLIFVKQEVGGEGEINMEEMDDGKSPPSQHHLVKGKKTLSIVYT